MLDSRLLEPRGIALVGASADTNKLAGRPLQYLREAGYTGRVVPVNPAGGEIDGTAVRTSCRQLAPGEVDLAMVLVGNDVVPAVLEDIVHAGIPYAVVVASGFGESGREDLDEAVRKVLDGSGTRLIGPNCVGVVVPAARVAASFATTLRDGMYPAGHIGLVTQSGAVGNSIVMGLRERGLGLRAWITSGNELDVDVLELAGLLGRDAETGVVGLFVEGLRDGARLVPIGRAIARTGALAILRGGLSEEGRRASASHTGKIGTSAAVWRGVARQARAAVAADRDELLALLEAFAVGQPASRDGVAIATVSGGFGVLMSDQASFAGVPLADLGDRTRRRLADVLGAVSGTFNPLDTSLAPADRLADCVSALLQDPSVGYLVLLVTSLAHDLSALARDLPALADAATGRHQRIVVTYLSDVDRLSLEAEQSLRRAGVAFAGEPRLALRMVGGLVTLRRDREAAA